MLLAPATNLDIRYIQRRINKSAGASLVADVNGAKVKQMLFAENARHEVARASEHYVADLRRLRNALKSKSEVKFNAQLRDIFVSEAARTCAAARVVAKRKIAMSLSDLKTLAAEFSMRRASGELVRVIPLRKWDRTYRPVLDFGLRRRTAQRLSLDILEVLGAGNPFEYNWRERGVKQAHRTIEHAMHSGIRHWVTGDIKDFFPSLKPKHCGFLELPEETVQNVIFGLHNAPMIQPTGVSFTTGPRQGLPQGACTSSFVASAFLGRELRAALLYGNGVFEGVVVLSYVDNIAVGAANPATAYAFMEALKERLGEHPAGRIVLKIDEPTLPHEGFNFLGEAIFLEAGGDHVRVHMHPTRRAFEKFYATLAFDTRDLDEDLVLPHYLSRGEEWALGRSWTMTEESVGLLETGLLMAAIEELDRRRQVRASKA